jgi:hypothetical protein
VAQAARGSPRSPHRRRSQSRKGASQRRICVPPSVLSRCTNKGRCPRIEKGDARCRAAAPCDPDRSGRGANRCVDAAGAGFDRRRDRGLARGVGWRRTACGGRCRRSSRGSDFGLASAGRNTAGALGVGFGYLVIVGSVVRGLRPRLDALSAHRQRGDVHHQLADRLPDARALDDRGGAAPGGGRSRSPARGRWPVRFRDVN